MDVDGWTVSIGTHGSVQARVLRRGGWDEVASLHRAAEPRLANAPTWRVKVLILLRTDIVERGADGVARLRRGVLRADDLERVQAEIAQFAVVAEAWSGGAVKLDFDLDVDEAQVSVDSTEDPYGQAFLEETLAPLVNGAVFDPTDPKDRGPYDSAFVLHPALVRDGADAVVLGTSASSIPVQRHARPGELALTMADAWTRHLAHRMSELGFPVGDEAIARSAFGGAGSTAVTRPDAFMAPDLWRVVGERFAPAAAYQAHAARDLPPHSPWESARANPYRLPLLGASALRALAGTDVQIAVQNDRVAFSASGHPADGASTFDANEESTATLSLDGKRLLFVEWSRADLFGSHLDPARHPQVEGWLREGGWRFVVFSLDPGPAEPEINLIDTNGVPVRAIPALRGTPSRLEVPEGARTSPGAGDLVQVTTADQRQRWAALSWVDPVEIALPESLALAGDTVSIEAHASAAAEAVRVHWEVPPGWDAPADGPLKEGANTWTFRAPAGALDQELRCTLSQPSTGWSRTATVRVERLPSPVGLELTFGPGTVPAVTGGFEVAPNAEGEGVLVTEAPGARGGRVLLLRRQGRRPVFHTGTHPFLELTLDGSKAEPLDLVVLGTDGRESRVRLFDVPGAMGAAPAPRVAVATGTTTLDLRSAGVSGEVAEVWLEAPPEAALYERPLGASSLVLHRVRVRASPEGSVNPILPGKPVAPKADGDTWQRAAAAAQAPTAALLQDPRDIVAFNAAAAAGRVKAPALIPELATLVRSLESNVCREAIEALAFQDTPAAWEVVTKALDSGPGDEARASAARVLGRERKLVAAAPLTSMIVALSWRARATGAQALASLPGAEPAQLALVFLQDVHPAVRLEVVRNARMEIDPVARRVQFESVNDPSDRVRIASYLALTRCLLPGMADEGYRGVRDDSPAVRLALLEAFRREPAPAARGALRLAVVDTDPRVRAAALRALAVSPGDVTLEELGGVLEEVDARIQAALVELAVAKRLALPPTTIALLRASTDPEVARWARDRQP